MYLIAARGGCYAQDGGRYAQMRVMIGIQVSVNIVRLCRGDEASQTLLRALAAYFGRLGTREKMYLIAAGGGCYAQDGGRYAQMRVLIGIQESVKVVWLCRGDHTSQKPLPFLCLEPILLCLGRFFTDHLCKAHAQTGILPDI